MPYTFQSVRNIEKLTDAVNYIILLKAFQIMEISFLSYAVKSKHYLVNQFMRRKVWKIFFHGVS